MLHPTLLFLLTTTLRAVVFGVLAVLCVTVIGFAGRWWWLADLAAAFRMQYALACALALVVLLVARQWPWAGIAAVGLIINLAVIVPLFFGVARTAGPAQLRVVCQNLLATNRMVERVVQHAQASEADVLVFLEATDDWIVALQPLERTHPHFWVEPEPGAFGIVLYSRHPLRSVGSRDFGGGVLSIVAELELGSPLQTYVICGTHPPPAFTAGLAERHRRHMTGLAEWSAAETRPLVIVGDLNATPWSWTFRDLLQRGRLTDSTCGYGWQPTWQVRSLCAIPIDHALTREFRVVNRQVGPDVGSDHRSVLVDIRLP